MELTLRPAPTRKSTSTDFIFVWPLLKSSPPMRTPVRTAASTTPGTNVFCGDPLMNGTPSSMHASANSVLGDTCAAHPRAASAGKPGHMRERSAAPARASDSLRSMAARSAGSVSCTPSATSL